MYKRGARNDTAEMKGTITVLADPDCSFEAAECLRGVLLSLFPDSPSLRFPLYVATSAYSYPEFKTSPRAREKASHCFPIG